MCLCVEEEEFPWILHAWTYDSSAILTHVFYGTSNDTAGIYEYVSLV
jgi:hypothetical protein